jgi:TPR repeat protein
MRPIRRSASADFLMALVVSIFLSGCGENTTSQPVSNVVTKNTPEQVPSWDSLSKTPSVSNEVAKKTPEQVLADLTKKAEAGDAEAQFALGMMHRDGFNYDKDGKFLNDEATEWLQKAANQGHAKAQFNLAVAYSFGRGVPKNTAKAMEWYQKAAAQGHAEAQYHLATTYYEGNNGVTKDLAKAAGLFQSAAAQENVNAQGMLGVMYSKGEGVPKDLAKAAEWWQKAAEQGATQAQFKVGWMYRNGLGVPKDSAKAAEWFKKAAAQGDEVAQGTLGGMYWSGEGVSTDRVLAYAWVNLASISGEKAAGNLRNAFERLLSSGERAEAQRISSTWRKGQVLVREGRPAIASAGTASTPGILSKKGTGTIFVVGKMGHAVTNQHVTGGCSELRIQGRDGVAKLVTEDIVNDLSLVQIPGAVKDTAAIAAEPGKLRQGEDIVVFGFPLNAVLSSGGNLTPGVVSAMTGLGNNTNQIQITAPIQPGSSGSPVMNKKGEVVGVVSMKLSDSKMAKATGSIGQNVNFAVSGQTLKTFLDAHKVEYRTGGLLSFDKNTADLADEARKWTLVIECWR